MCRSAEGRPPDGGVSNALVLHVVNTDLESHDGGDMLDELRDAEDHVGCRAVLLERAIDLHGDDLQSSESPQARERRTFNEIFKL